MKTPPDIDLNSLSQELESTYGIQAKTISFIPRGEMSWGYRLDAPGGDQYFLKLFRETLLPDWAARLTYRLHTDCHIEQVSFPLPALSGEVINTLAGFPAALFPFIAGQSLFETSARHDVLYRLGQILAHIHNCHSLDMHCHRVEKFDAWGLAKYRQVIEACTSLPPLPGAAGEAQRLLWPLKDRLGNLLSDLLLCQRRVRQRNFTPCICHGDPTPGNILVTPDGLPYLIDWDDLILAPRERDLVFWEHDVIFFESEAPSPVLAGYHSVTGSSDLEPELLGFYHRQWTVGEIAEYGHRLLFEHHDDQQNQSDLENLQAELQGL